jgi:hypothetical protein
MTHLLPSPDVNHAYPNSRWDKLEINMPSLLRKGGSSLLTEQDKDVFYYSMITGCSAIIPTWYTIYHQKEVFMNLQTIITGPPGANKSLAMAPRTALRSIHEELVKDSTFRLSVYNQQLAEAQKSKGVPPLRPPMRVLFIPGNVTSSKLIQHLADNGPDYPSLIVESELDTVINSVKSDFGGHSDIFRNVFHNEGISSSRRNFNEYLEVSTPKLAILQTGTGDQVARYIGSAENGLFSRHIFYLLKGSNQWEDVSPRDECESFSDKLRRQADEYYKYYKFFKGRKVRFNFTKSQWLTLNEKFRQELKAVTGTGDLYKPGVLKRHSLMLVKIAGVLSSLRCYELNYTDQYIECLDKDFEIAMELVSVSLDCSFEMLEQLPQPKKQFVRINPKKQEFFLRLQKTFTRSEAIACGSNLNQSTRTLDRWLQEFIVDGKIQVEAHGSYMKVESQLCQS